MHHPLLEVSRELFLHDHQMDCNDQVFLLYITTPTVEVIIKEEEGGDS